MLRLCTRRRRWLIADGDGLALAELAEDRVTAQTMGRGTEATHWREIEVERGAQAHAEGGDGFFTFGLLYGIEAARAARAKRALPDRWARLQKP